MIITRLIKLLTRRGVRLIEEEKEEGKVARGARTAGSPSPRGLLGVLHAMRASCV